MSAEDNVTVTIKIDEDLLERVDARARELDLNRSQYFRKLARLDMGADVAIPTNGAPLPVDNDKAA